MAQLAGSPWRGNASVRLVEGVGSRNFRCTAGDFVVPGAAGDGDLTAWEGDAVNNNTMTFRLDWDSTGAPTLQNPTAVRVEVRLPGGATLGSTWTPGGGGSGSFTRTVHFDADPLDQSLASSGARRSGMLEIYIFVERTGVGSYTADSRGATSGAAGGVGITNDWAQGYIRSRMVLNTHSLSNISIGGSEPPEFRYPYNIFLRTSLWESLYESCTITARLRQGGSDKRTKTHVGTATNRDFSWNATSEKIDTTTPQGTYDVRLDITASDFGGDNKFVWEPSFPFGWTQNTDLQIEYLSRFTVNPGVTLTLVSTPDLTSKVFNRGEIISGIIAKIVNAGGEGFVSRGTETFRSLDISSSGLEETMTINSHDHTAGANAGEHTLTQTFAASGNVAPADTEGSAKAIRWRDSPANSPTPADTSQYGLLSSLYTVEPHLQLNDNLLDPSKLNTDRLVSDLAFFSARIKNVREEPVNGASGTLSLQDDANLESAITHNGTTANVNGFDGYLPLKAWSSQLPSGAWDLFTTVDFTKDGNTGTKSRLGTNQGDFGLISPNPKIVIVVGAGHALSASSGNHWQPGEPLLVGVALFDRENRQLQTVDTTPNPNVMVGRFNTDIGMAEYLESNNTWIPLIGAAQAYRWELSQSPTDPKIWIHTFSGEDTSSWGFRGLFVVGMAFLNKTPYQLSISSHAAGSKNLHLSNKFDPTGLFA